MTDDRRAADELASDEPAQDPSGYDEDEPELEPPPRTSRGCAWLGCALVIALVVGVGLGLFALGHQLEPLADRFLWQPHDVVREYLAAHNRGETERTALFTCPGDGQLDPFAPLPGRAGAPYVEDELPYPRPAGRVAIYYRADPHGPIAQALLERQPEGWRICAFEPG